MTRTKLMPWLVVVSLAAGAASTWYSLASTTDTLRALARRRADLRELRAIEAGLQARMAAVAQYESLASSRPSEPEAILKNAGMVVRPELRFQEPKPALEGWETRGVEMTFDQIRLADLGRLIKAAGDERPPWLIRECSITASEQAPGSGRAVLVLEILAKKDGLQKQF